MADNKVSKADAQAAFESFDADKSGFLDAKEFFDLAGTLGQLLDDNEVAAAMKTIDTSGDGKIQFDEFFAWLSSDRQSSEKDALTVGRLKAALLASKACRFLGQLAAAQKDVKIAVRVGNVDAPKMSVSAGLVDGHVVSDAELKEVGGENIVASFDVGHHGGEVNQKFFDEVFKNVMKLIPHEQDFPFAFKLSHPNDNTVRVSAFIPKELERSTRSFVEGFAMVQQIVGASVSGKFEVNWDAKTLAEKVDFNAADLSGFKVSVNGSIPAELPQLIAQKMNVPGINAMQKPEGADEAETCFNLNLALSQGLIQMFLSSAPDIARTPLRDLYAQMLLPQIKSSNRKYKKFVQANVVVRCGLLSLNRIITEVKGAHIRIPSGFGASIELAGFKFRDFFDALDQAVPFDSYDRNM